MAKKAESPTKSQPKSIKRDLVREVDQVIKRQHVVMQPKWHFALLGVAFALLTVLIFFTSVVSYHAIFWQFAHLGVHHLVGLGRDGWLYVFGHLPWLLILLSVAATVGLIMLVRHFELGYRHNTYYLISGVLAVVVVGGTIYALTGVSRAFQHNGVVQGIFYPFAKSDFDRLIGQVIKVDNSKMTLLTESGKKTIQLTASTHVTAGMALSSGETVVVYVREQGNNLTAEIIHGVVLQPERFRRLVPYYDKDDSSDNGFSVPGAY